VCYADHSPLSSRAYWVDMANHGSLPAAQKAAASTHAAMALIAASTAGLTAPSAVAEDGAGAGAAASVAELVVVVAAVGAGVAVGVAAAGAAVVVVAGTAVGVVALTTGETGGGELREPGPEEAVTSGGGDAGLPLPRGAPAELGGGGRCCVAVVPGTTIGITTGEDAATGLGVGAAATGLGATGVGVAGTAVGFGVGAAAIGVGAATGAASGLGATGMGEGEAEAGTVTGTGVGDGTGPGAGGGHQQDTGIVMPMAIRQGGQG